ncbi:type II secretion system protein GspM [Desulfomarina sp.]
MRINYFQYLRRKSGIDSLDERDRKVLFWGGLFVCCFLVLQIGILPFQQARQHLEKSVLRKKEELVTIRRLQNEYRRLKAEEGGIYEKVKLRSNDFTLFTFLDTRAARVGVKKMIQYMKPSSGEGEGNLREFMVEMKLQGVGLQQLVEFLLAIESEKDVVAVKRIAIQKNGAQTGALDAVLQVTTYELKAGK